MAGVPHLEANLDVSILSPLGTAVDRILRQELEPTGYGYVYERCVGLDYEARGFAVEYRFHLGFHDRGVDLLASSDHEIRFVQCKCTAAKANPARIEHMLYAASALVAERRSVGKRLFFDLSVPSVSRHFPQPRRGENRALVAFERYNLTQQAVRLTVREVCPEFIRALDRGAPG